MRELSTFETCYLAGLLVLSLALPLMMSGCLTAHTATRRACMKTVWYGQTLLAICALLVLMFAGTAPYAAFLGAANCLFCTWAFRRHLQGAVAK